MQVCGVGVAQKSPQCFPRPGLNSPVCGYGVRTKINFLSLCFCQGVWTGCRLDKFTHTYVGGWVGSCQKSWYCLGLM